MSDHTTSLGHEEVAWELDVLPAQPATQKKYKCPRCPSSFKRPENLKRHQRGHEDRKFVCQICDKSFARSDILGRHLATHIPREQRDDNSHRRRACRECARVRERCSRGEPCRRCTIKALCCVYPEESQFKTMMPHTWSPSIFEPPDDNNAAGVGSSGTDSTPRSPRDGLLLDYGSSQWQVEDSPGSLPEQYILSPSVVPHNCPYPCFAGHQEVPFASSFRYDGLSPQYEGLYAGSASTNDLEFITSNAEPDGAISGVYYQPTDMSSKLTSSLDCVDIYQPSPFRGNYIDEPPLDYGHFGTGFDACTPSFGTHASNILGQPEIPDFSSSSQASQENLADVQAIQAIQATTTMGFGNNQEVPFHHHHSLQTPPWSSSPSSSMADLKAYDYVTPTFGDFPQEKSSGLFDASMTAPRTNQQNYFPRLY